MKEGNLGQLYCSYHNVSLKHKDKSQWIMSIRSFSIFLFFFLSNSHCSQR